MRAVIFDFFGVVFNPSTGSVMSGLVPFLEKLQQASIPCGIASSTQREEIQHFLQEQQLDQYFAIIIGIGEVAQTKPDPECYQKVAEYFQVQPADCLIIDDSESALTAAANQGFHTIYFGNGLDNFSKIATLIGL